MHVHWITSSAELPREGQQVEFVLDGRDVPMGGAYVQRIFQTRWTGYEAERVRAWRSADANSSFTENEGPRSIVLADRDASRSRTCCEKLSSGEGAYAAESAHANLSIGQTSSLAFCAGSRNRYAG